MKIILPFFAVSGIAAVIYIGVKVYNLQLVFGIILPYLCFILALVGFIARIIRWAASPVPFHIPTVCGQQRSLPWIRSSKIDSPVTGLGVLFRVLGEVLFFRSLFRNDRANLYGEQKRIIYSSDKLLWVGALLFHWFLLVIILRHLRLFLEPVPSWIISLQGLDGIFETTMPGVYISNVFISLSILYLLFRRFRSRIRYISLPADYFILFLLGGIILSGILMRHIYRIDILDAKAFIMGLIYLKPMVHEGLGAMFYVHLGLVSILTLYIPHSKLMHMAGVFLSPTRNLKNNSRMKRHINPWDYPVKVHTYEEWEDEFKDALKEAGIPLDR
ncbi:MAG: sulfate reduction electron transfer complex DsrMKJOP subunit DsrM [Syntrophorhabdaceae bacterium]|nr:sulfate reduction electron transfer complex DsrMKJOP subunit DsrM [Syntrophorhabdaceae bacterium]